MRGKRILLKKTSLIFCGVISAFIILELFLRLGGFYYMSFIENKISYSSGEYRILCLGESTTAAKWPVILSSMLKVSGCKAAVIDKGDSGTNTGVILSFLPMYIDKYKPDMVISMMGINDKSIDTALPVTPLYEAKGRKHRRLRYFFKNSRVNKLFKLISLSIELKTGSYLKKEDMIFPLIPKPEEIDSYEEYIYWAKQFRYKHDSKASESLLKKALEIKGDSPEVYIELGNLYRDSDEKDLAMKYYSEAEDISPGSPELYLEKSRYYKAFKEYEKAREYYIKTLDSGKVTKDVYMELAQVYDILGEFMEELMILRSALVKYPEDTEIFLELAYWQFLHNSDEHNYEEALDYILKAKDQAPDNDRVYELLAMYYAELGKLDKTEEACLESLRLNPEDNVHAHRVIQCRQVLNARSKDISFKSRLGKFRQEILPNTKENYRELCSYVTSRGIKMVAVQYPMADVNILKEMLQDISPEIYFVDNGPSFKKIVEKQGYRKVFVDSFAGNFGHCTDYGYNLLAADIFNVIIDKVKNEHST